MRLNEKIIKIRCELQRSSIKKSGKNKAQGFTYFELADFLPTLNELMLKHGVNDCISVIKDHMFLTLISGDETQEYAIPFIIFDTPENNVTEWVNGKKEIVKDSDGNIMKKKTMQDIQYLGAMNTYYKRYIYLNTFGITSGEVIDAMDISTTQSKPFVAEELPNTIKTDLEMIRDKLNIQLEITGTDKREFALKHNLSKNSTYDQFLKAYNAIA